MTTGRWRRAALGVSWVAALTLTLVVLDRLGRGSLAAPPLSPDRWGDWSRSRDAATITFALVRGALVIATWYLLAVSLLTVVGRLSGRQGVDRMIELTTTAPIRRLLGSALGVGLTASASALALLPSLRATNPAPVSAEARPISASPVETVVIRASGDPRPTPTVTVAPDPSADDAATATMTVVEGDPPPVRRDEAPSTWTAAPGDHFWHMSVSALAIAWGRPPTDSEVERYWLQLIEVNRERLVDPDDADLIFPGQRFELPAIPTTPPTADQG